MKVYYVYFKKPVTITYLGDRFNKEKGKWEYNVECVATATQFEFHSLQAAKKAIKANIGNYKGSAIYKIWANGDFEVLGEIKLRGV